MFVIPLAVIGKGNVGRALLGQLAPRREALRRLGIDLRVVLVAGRRAAIRDGAGIPDATLAAVASGAARLEALPDAVPLMDWQQLTEWVRRLDLAPPVIVDVTAEESGAWHREWLRLGWRVVTANKKPLAGEIATYDLLASSPAYRYGTTVGAGLPVVSTLQDLLATGDEIVELQASVSGTLGFIFSACAEGRPFAESVAEAKALGYAEPDPRDDLSGMDVARKALILARLTGLRLELADIAVESLVPQMDAIDERLRAAAADGNVLRYLVHIAPGGVRVGLDAVRSDSPFGSLGGPDNLFIVRSRRYDARPLVIRGPGAGAEVTAAGVFADVLKLAAIARPPQAAEAIPSMQGIASSPASSTGSSQ